MKCIKIIYVRIKILENKAFKNLMCRDNWLIILVSIWSNTWDLLLIFENLLQSCIV